MTRIFLTGASGYVGGDLLHVLRATHPEHQYSVLVRDSAKAATLMKTYPEVRVVIGDLDSVDLVETEARQADIVIHAASSSHIKSVEAIARAKPAHWIQISGASVLSIPDIVAGTYGESSNKDYSDVDGVEEVRALIERNSNKRVVDNFVLNCVTESRTALIYPPIIYGQGRGVLKQRSVQIPELARVALQTKTTIQVGKGESTWSNVHIADVSDIFVKLVEKAVAGVAGVEGGLWNREGVYFAANAMLNFGKISQVVAEAAHSLGLVESAVVKEVSHEEADKLSGHGGVLWGTNARQISQRARQQLGWTPRGISIEEEIPVSVQAEAKALGLV